MTSYHGKSFVNNLNNSFEISQLLLGSDLLTEAETAELNRINSFSGSTVNRTRKEYLMSILSPYFDQIDMNYKGKADGFRVLEQVLERIRDIRRREAIAELESQKAAIDEQIRKLKAEDDAYFKTLKEKVNEKNDKRAKDEESLDLDRMRNNPYAYMQVFVPAPPSPPPPEPEIRYEGAQFIEHLLDDPKPEPENSYVDWDKLNKIMLRLNKEPFGTYINIKDLIKCNLLEHAAPYLKDWFEKHIMSRSEKPTLVRFESAGSKAVEVPIQKILNNLHSMFTNNTFFKIDSKADGINVYDETIYLNMWDRIMFKDISEPVKKPDSLRSVHGDGFFPRKLSGNYKKLEPFLEKLQIYSSYLDQENKVKKSVNIPCLIYALQQGGIEEDVCQMILAYVGFQKRINRKQWTDICNEFNLRIHLRIVTERGDIDVANKSNKGWYGPENGTEVYLAEYLDHVFIDEPLPITSYALRNWNTIHDMNDNIEYLCKTYKLKNGKPSIDNKKANFRSLDAVLAIDRAGGFESIKADDEDVVTANVFGYEIQEPEPIASQYNEKAHTRLLKPDKKDKREWNTYYPIYYADFETCKQSITDIDGVSARAVPFMLCITSQNGKWEQTYTGFNCMDQMMEDIAARTKKQCIIYFHNLGFDGNFLMKYANKQMIKKGNKIMQIPLEHKEKTIILKDSYSLFPKKLAAFPSSFPDAFKNTQIQKEFFPYDYYTFDRIQKCLEYEEYCEHMAEYGGECEDENSPTNEIGNFSECRKELNLSVEDAKQFSYNLCATGSVINTKRKSFDMLKYCRFYCMQDVRVLRTGFEAFAAATAADPINLNIHNFLTLPSVADYYMKKHVFYPNGKICELNGPVQKFIQQAVYGGRCMTANNKRHFINNGKSLYDFDARSLYPSAMRRMFTVEGAPEYYENSTPEAIFGAHNLPDILVHSFDEQQVTPTEEKYISQFFVEITITNVGIHRAFPLIVKREKELNKQTNCNECVSMVVDMITLQDLIEFQDIEFKLGNGYIMKGNRDYRVQEVIQKLYDLRNEYKKTKNPTQEVIKLIMNSAYGKSIQKPIKSFLQFVKKDQFDFFVRDRYHQICEITEIDENTYLFELAKQKSLQFNNVVFGVTVLSMSKRIMNEVMCLAEDENIEIYYQDTDSMHIESDKLSHLADAFQRKYNRVLIGDNMGQFHDDFDELSNNPRAIVHISAGKKMYYDKLINDNGETAEHFRMKGVPQQCIINTANKKFHGSVESLYTALYHGQDIEFDLLDGKVCMIMDKRGNVHYKSRFTRILTATSE